MSDTVTLSRAIIEDTIHALERYAVKRQDFERFESELAMLEAALAAPQPDIIPQESLFVCGQMGANVTKVCAEPQPVKQADYTIRGQLTALKCWHRLTEAEADDLVVFTAMLIGAKP